MHIIDDKQKRLADESKTKLLQLMQSYEISQDELALGLGGIDRTIISRWMNHESDLYPNIFLITNCLTSRDIKLEKMALEFLDWMESLAGRSALPWKAKTDGSVEDEFSDAAIAEGDFAKAKNAGDLDKMERIAKRFQEIGSRLTGEVVELRKKRQA